ncbi:hypothetical protein RSAG8_03416, partial [Rhizoctonia solani AG-8 WAC10335]
MAPRSRAVTRHSTRMPDKATSQVSRSWRKRTRLISPSPTSDSDSESKSPTSSNHGFQGFMSLPVDVFVNIASYFQLQDVLALSRVNSFLRRLLRSRESEPIWRSARLNLVGLPPCPKELSEPKYAALLFSKISILPRYSEDWPERGPWCFYDDVKVVKVKLDEFDAAGDANAKESWIKRRQEIVKAREQSSEPLREWFQQLEANREAELDHRRVARETEIKTRLKALGHDERDMVFRDSSVGSSLVRNASPLTDKAWKEMLPKLVKIIKANHRERISLKRESRCFDVLDWAQEICGPKIFRLWHKDNYYYNQGLELNATTILLDGLESQPEVESLLDRDLSDDEFERHFESQQPNLADLLTSWVDEQEARLVSMMPCDILAPDFDHPSSESTMTFVTDDNPTRLPMGALPINTQTLLRADAIFVHTPSELDQHTSTSTNICYFYPDFDGLPDTFTYSNLASEIAASLLACLGRPNASHS